MKLRTERRESSDSSFVLDGWKDQFVHDAAYANALVKAMDEVPEHLMGSNVTRWIKSRADEIMRGFGYTEDDHGSG